MIFFLARPVAGPKQSKAWYQAVLVGRENASDASRGLFLAELAERHAHFLMNHYFNRLAERTSRALGSAWAFVGAVGVVLLWALCGPAFHYNDTWQLTINTGTTIITFLMVFLIQNSQNRDARATQLKIDELLRAIDQARTSMVNLQELSDQELAALEADFRRLGRSRAASEVVE